MGNRSTTERLAVPLLPQLKPFQLSRHSTVTTVPTKLCIQIPAWRSEMQVINEETSELLYEIKCPFTSTRMSISTPDGIAVMSVNSEVLQCHYHLYEGSETEKESFSIAVKHPMQTPLIVLVEFEDQASGGLCRVLVEGDSTEKVSIIYLERGSPDLSHLEIQENVSQSQYQAIGRINRHHHFKEEFVEAAAGVDLTLLLVLWLVRYNIEQQIAATS